MEKGEDERRQAELQQDQQQHEHNTTEAAVPDPMAPAPVAASSKKEAPKLTPEQRVQSAWCLILKAVQGGDINAVEWVNAGRRIRILKEWSQNIITPLPQEEVDRAGIIQVRALALEAALPAWKKSAIAQQAVKGFLSRSSSEAPGEEATDCWAFLRKAPAAPDSAEQVLQKVRESQQAWEAAVANFEQHISSLRVGGGDNALALSVGPQTSAEVNGPLAQVCADELSNLEQFQKFSEKYLKALERQEEIEGAMAAYNAAPNQSNFDRATEAIKTLTSFSAEILKAKKQSPQQFQEQWKKHYKRSNYIAAVYRANLATMCFWAEAGALYQEGTPIRDRDTQPTLSPDLLAKGTKVVALFNKAIAAKKGLLSEESRLEIPGLEREDQEPLTPEEAAAAKRIAEFQREINAIKREIFYGSFKWKYSDSEF
ncbi:MAG: hypothetical protein NT164_08295 [Verrucomicrobiae bacterium]|nr:hypothetical protein [Verrucomicrobiae bacterium]